MKGIILAGGSGTRLYPLTMVTSKQLLPVYNKPMIYYPLSTLMLARIRDILVISTPEDTPRIRQLLGDGSAFGLRLNYAVQAKPEGLAQAFLIGRDFIGDEPCAMILGDNIFYGNGLGEKLCQAGQTAESGEATIFGYYVEDPERFGVMEFETGVSRQENAESVRVIGVEEKPQKPRSNYAIVGLYFYPAGVVNMAERVRPSARGELEITSLNEMYLREGRLQAQLLGRGFTWLDAGTFDSLRRATNFVCMLEEYQGMTISAPEEIAFRLGWIDETKLRESAEKYGKSPYGAHLRNVLEGRIVLGGGGGGGGGAPPPQTESIRRFYHDRHRDRRGRVYRLQLHLPYAQGPSGGSDRVPGQAHLRGEPLHAQGRDGTSKLPLCEARHLRPGRRVRPL